MIHFFCEIQILLFLFRFRRHKFMNFGALDTCMQRHEDTVFHTPNTLGNVAKHTLNDSAMQGDGSQGQFFHLVAKRAKFIPQVRPNS